MGETVFNINQKVLIMTEAYPFFLVGTIASVDTDTVGVNAQFGVPLPLQNNVFYIKKDSIAAFYAETESCQIPTVW